MIVTFIMIEIIVTVQTESQINKALTFTLENLKIYYFIGKMSRKFIFILAIYTEK